MAVDLQLYELYYTDKIIPHTVDAVQDLLDGVFWGSACLHRVSARRNMMVTGQT